MKRCLGCMESYNDELDICPHCGYMEGTLPEEAIHAIPGTVLKERYIIGKVVGYGGFGVTYIAWDTLLQHRVAIKEYLPSEFSTRIPGTAELTVFNGDKSQQFLDGMKKFLDEARRLAKFQNESGIVKIYDCFEENRTAYIIMEYLEGITLSEYLKENGTVPEDVAVQMLMPIMNSLKAVHKEGIIHRDIAPDNIMITSNGEIKLIDFGAARYATTSHSRSLTVIIKPGYSPEEQYRSRGDQGPHTDVHALGAVLYRMITGQVPPDAMERRAYFENGNKDILEPISKYVKNISQNRENAILNAMNVRIEDRSPDMDTLIHELTTDEPVARVCGKIKKIDILKWPLWLKITVPTALVAIITLTVLFITGVIGFDIHSPREIWIPDGMTRVPRVVSMNEDEALTLLSEKQLSYVVVGMRYDEQIGEGCILTQGSSVGSVVPVNSALDVVISAGIETMEVPYITGFTQEHAIEELVAQSFTYEIVESYDSVIEKGCIVSQSVAGGTELDKGTMLTLVVSKGRDPEISYTFEGEEMPDINGMLLDDAKAVCEDYGIKLVVTEYEYSNEYDGMCVITQGIDAGSYIQSDIVVEIVLSKGAIVYKVPSILYLTEEEAKERLNAKELQYNITYAESETVAEGCVVSQSVQAGTIIEPTMVIDVVVSSGPPKFAMVDVVGKMEGDAIATLQELGLIVTSDYVFDDTVEEGTVLLQSVEAGEPVSKRYEIVITVAAKTDLITVPDVIDKEFETVKSELEALGFKVEKNEIYSTEIIAGNIISQTPQANSKQKANTKILLTVSLGKDPVNVTFDANGGIVSESIKVVYYTDSYGTLPTPTRENYVFLGWYTSVNAGTKIDENTIVGTNNDQTLYARWERILVNVSFDANGGNCGVTNTYMGLGECYELPTASREFYTFKGWYETKTGGVPVTADTIVIEREAHTLYAQWEIKTSKVTYDAGSGKVDGNSSVTYNLGTTYGDVKATRSGYVFIGWYTKENGGGEKILPSTIVTNESAHTLYAYWSNDAYTVSFDSNGGSSCENVPVVYDEAYGTLPTPERQYYKFEGWYTAKTGGTKIDENSIVSMNKNHTLYAHWTRKTVVVTYILGDGSTKPITYELGVKYSTNMPTTTKTGYTFDGWYFDQSRTKAVGESLVENENNHTVYSKWNANKYTVTFKPDNSTAITNPVQTVTYGEQYLPSIFPTTARTGYKFYGWFTEKNGQGKDIYEWGKVDITEDITVYPYWKPITYEVKYDANNGTGIMSNSTHTYDVAKALTANKFKRSYYEFNGWNIKADGTGTAYSDTASVKNLTANDGETVTLYAQWKSYTYSVKYNGNGSNSGSMTNSTFDYNVSAALKANAYEKTGYTFNGWNTKADGTGTKYTDKQSVSKLTATNGGTVTLYAQWKVNTYTVKYDGNGATTGSMSNSSHTYDIAKSLTANIYKRTGYTFAGWNTKADGTGTTYADGVSVKNLSTTNGETVTLYAKWTANTYSVKYDGNGATTGSMSNSSHTYNTANNLTANAYKKYYCTFTGWNTKADGTGTSYANNASVKNLSSTNGATVTLYAQWSDKAESDWVLSTAVPSSAKITDTKYKYVLTSYTTSTSNTKDGWTLYDTTWEWGNYGSWSDWSTTQATSSDSRKVETKTEENTYETGRTLFNYSHYEYWNTTYQATYWTYSYEAAALRGTNIVYEELGWSTTELFLYTKYGESEQSWGTEYNGEVWYNEQTKAETVTETITYYRYADRSKVYTYHFKKSENKETATDPSNQTGVSNVVKWVKYIEQ